MLRFTIGRTTLSARWIATFGLGMAALIACGSEKPSDDDDGSGSGNTASASGQVGSATGSGGGASASASGAGGSVDEACATGVGAFCFCVENAGEPACTSQEQTDYYNLCTSAGDNGFFECFGSYVNEQSEIDCNAALAGCESLLPDG
jgi:hypothetical protein